MGGAGTVHSRVLIKEQLQPKREKNGSLSITNVKELIGSKMSRGAEDKRQTREGRNAAGRASGGQ